MRVLLPGAAEGGIVPSPPDIMAGLHGNPLRYPRNIRILGRPETVDSKGLEARKLETFVDAGAADGSRRPAPDDGPRLAVIAHHGEMDQFRGAGREGRVVSAKSGVGEDAHIKPNAVMRMLGNTASPDRAIPASAIVLAGPERAPVVAGLGCAGGWAPRLACQHRGGRRQGNCQQRGGNQCCDIRGGGDRT